MDLKKIPVPEVYKDSADFRFFLEWFATALTKLQYDTDNLSDIYDPQRCPSSLLWMLCDTIGFRYDDRLPPAFNRLVLLYFMSVIRNRGSKDGVTLAAELNLAQFRIINAGKEKEILNDRLDDTTIPVNAAYVTPHTDLGYIDIVYFSTQVPTDACIEYARPLGMYCFQSSGVRLDARTKVVIDTKLAQAQENSRGQSMSIGPTHVGHYSRNDYAKMQKMTHSARTSDDPTIEVDDSDDRAAVYYRNSVAQSVDPDIDPGFRTMYSLQLCNNSETVKSLLGPIYSLGYAPVKKDGAEITSDEYDTRFPWNLQDKVEFEGKPAYTSRFDCVCDGVTTRFKLGIQGKHVYFTVTEVVIMKRATVITIDYSLDYSTGEIVFVSPPPQDAIMNVYWTSNSDIYTVETGDKFAPMPRVNSPMAKLGDAMPKV